MSNQKISVLQNSTKRIQWIRSRFYKAAKENVNKTILYIDVAQIKDDETPSF